MPKKTPRPVPAVPVLRDLPATAGERRAAGRAARMRAPRPRLGDWDERGRGHDALTTVLAQSADRLPEVVPLRHYRMARSPWNYYRGAAAVMAADLASRPHSGLEVQLCGDAHVLNFGLWATPERNLNFDLRDFDETLPGPFEWDVARLAASLVVAARENRVKTSRADAAVRAAVDAYRRRMRRYADAHELDIWYDGMRVDRFVEHFERADRGQVKVYIEKRKAKKTSRGAFPKLTCDGPRPSPHHRATADPRHPVRRGTARGRRRACWPGTARRSKKIDAPCSTALPKWTSCVRWSGSAASAWSSISFCSKGRSGADPLFLQCKQAGASVYEASLRPRRAGESRRAGRRRANGWCKSATDMFVGWGSLGGRDFYVRQYRDMKLIVVDRT